MYKFDIMEMDVLDFLLLFFSLYITQVIIIPLKSFKSEIDVLISTMCCRVL